MTLVHKFIQDKEFYVIDVNSGSVHLVDELVYDLIDEDKLKGLEDLKNALRSKYNENDIEEAYNDIKELVSEGMLYSMDLYEHIAMNDNNPSYVKALCLNIIHDCNLRCKYCFADEGEYKGCRKPMPASIGKKSNRLGNKA